MPPKEDAGDVRDRTVGNLTTAYSPPRSEYSPLAAGRQRANEGYHWSRPTPVKNAGISMGVIDEKSLTRECITKCLQELDSRLEITTFVTCDDCLQNMENHDLVLYHIHEVMRECKSNHQELISFQKLLHTVPVIVLSDIEESYWVTEMFESGVRGFVSTNNTTLEQIIKIIELIKVGGVFVPPSSLSFQGNKGRGVITRSAFSDQFTNSELAVLDRLKLGKANKIIAHELGLSESTVKVHIGRIMKKLKVTNRTQVVSRVYALTNAGSHSSGEV
jgi:DNA-binding NarL/FixJ family response regulator